MSAQIELSPVFGRYTQNHLAIKVEGKTFSECIDDLVRQFPDIKKVIIDKDGNFGHSYDIFVNGESSYPLDMSSPVKDGDILNIVPMIYGG